VGSNAGVHFRTVGDAPVVRASIDSERDALVVDTKNECLFYMLRASERVEKVDLNEENGQPVLDQNKTADGFREDRVRNAGQLVNSSCGSQRIHRRCRCATSKGMFQYGVTGALKR